MPEEFVRQLWAERLESGSLTEIIDFLLFLINQNGTLSACILMLFTLTLRLVLISFYFCLLCFGMVYIKKRCGKKLSARVNYYCWYLLLLSVVLANLWFNNGIMALPSQLLRANDWPGCCGFIAVCLMTAVWLIVAVRKFTALMMTSRKIKRSFKRMERYGDNEGYARLASEMLGLRKKPDIWISDYIHTPVSYGVFKKAVLLPKDFEQKYSADEFFLLVLHEMTHIRHGDTVKLYIISLAGCLLWLMPVMRLFTASFKRDAEIFCDNHVIGLQESERDKYGKLILKECAYKNARFGFGFSDSYNAIENRLDALYRYKADGRPKPVAVIPAAVAVICVLSLAFRTERFIINDAYNSVFRIAVLDPGFGEYITLPPEVCADICEASDGLLNVNEDALRANAGVYADNGLITVQIISDNYIVRAGETDISSGFDSHYSYNSLPSEDSMKIVEVAEVLPQRSLAEYLLLLITSKL